MIVEEYGVVLLDMKVQEMLAATQDRTFLCSETQGFKLIPNKYFKYLSMMSNLFELIDQT